MNSFFPGVIASGNIFIEIFNYKEVLSLDVHKTTLPFLFAPSTQGLFKIHHPVGLFRLRLSLSPVKDHKWCHNFSDSSCGIRHRNQGIEDTSHFIFYAPSMPPQEQPL